MMGLCGITLPAIVEEIFLRDIKKLLQPVMQGGTIMKCFKKMQIVLIRIFLIVTTMMLGTTSILYAAGEIPYTFSPGQTISSDQVNANFQALSAQIAALQAQLGLASPISTTSVAGIYDYFLFGTGMAVKEFNAYDRGYRVMRTNYQGTLVLTANGTSTFNGTGGYNMMEIRSIIYQPDDQEHRLFSNVSGALSTDRPNDAGEMAYTVAGSTVTVGGGVIVATLSSDGKILAGIAKSQYENGAGSGIMIGIRRAPAITSATSSSANGNYKQGGASINITLNFSEAVTSTGLTIILNNNATIKTGAINNAPSWSGTYTVGAGQASSDLSISTITGAITSGLSAFSTTNPTIPAGQNIGDSKAIVIE